MKDRKYPYVGVYKNGGNLTVKFDKPSSGKVIVSNRVYPINYHSNTWHENLFTPIEEKKILPNEYQIKVSNKKELINAINALEEDGYYDVNNIRKNYADRVRYLVVRSSKNLGGNFNIPLIGFEVIEYEDFIKYREKENKGMKKGNFIIGSIHKVTGEVSFAKKPYIHTNYLSASTEIERLLKLDSNKKFIILEVKGIASIPSPDINWE